MYPNLDTNSQNVPVSQEGEPNPEMNLWEPPFERWLRLADSLLGNISPIRPIAPPKN